MEIIAIITGLALLQYTWFSWQVGVAHNKTGISAPTMTGDPILERAVRVHMNTAEQLIIFIPALWLFAHFTHDMTAAGLGLAFIIGRFIYAHGYNKAPEKRGVGFGITFLVNVVLMIGSIVGAGMAYAS